ncbi:MAG TPA: hypothetical protein VJ476_10125 [Rhizomicrobium sp.]|nr:hypothetical protein [Rhizomicrobium sp.]
MPLPRPEPGLVIRYDYLWLGEPARASGKERPACLVATLDDDADPKLVLILPITHSRPRSGTVGIEIPRAVLEKLGLDEARSWIVISEANVDFWPNAGLAPVPAKRGAYAYGFLPPGLFETVRESFVKLFESRRAKLVRR